MNAIVKLEATKAKARFAALPAKAQESDVAITRHGRIEAYVLSPERYAHLAAIDRVGGDVMQQLDADFEASVARMQSAAHARAIKRIASAPLDEVLATSTSKKPACKPRTRKPRA